MKVLFLCNRNTYINKLSRVRFHSVEAIGKICNLRWSGNNWDNYNNNLTVQENIDNIYKGEQPDIVIVYKPFEMKGFKDVRALKCIRYNEMYDIEWTKKEIEGSGAELVICHHENDCNKYKEIYKNSTIRFEHIAHCAEKSIYKDYKLEKNYDLFLCGALGIRTVLGVHYPLRERMLQVFRDLSTNYRCKVKEHPGYNHSDSYTNKYAVELAKEINSSKIAITCSGAPKTRFGKYIEIPMCHTAIAADIPDEDQENFKDFVIQIDNEMSDEEIKSKLIYYIENDKERQELVAKAVKWSKEYTQEKYAEKFLSAAKNSLSVVSSPENALPARNRSAFNDTEDQQPFSTGNTTLSESGIEKEPPLVSIVLTTYNRPDYLRRSMKSVLAQTYTNIELIVVNDCGEDVEHVIRDVDRSGRANYVRLSANCGLAGARNVGLRLARGKYLGFLDDDDWLDSNHVATLLNELEKGCHKVVYANSRRISEVEENGELITKHVEDPVPDWSQPFNADMLLVHNLMPVQTVLFHRNCLLEVGYFDENLSAHEDWDYWIRMSRKFKFKHVDITTSAVTSHADSMTIKQSRDMYLTMELIHKRSQRYADGRSDQFRRLLQRAQAAILKTLVPH